jgi:hypothetical protein
VEGVEGSLENRLTVAVVLLKNGFRFSTIWEVWSDYRSPWLHL